VGEGLESFLNINNKILSEECLKKRIINYVDLTE